MSKTIKLSKNLKLAKLKNLKNEKLFKFQKSAKSAKKLSKIKNLSNFYIKKNKSSFLTFDVKIAFHCLQLTLIKALIFQHFDPKCHIWIDIDALNYIIDNMLF